VSATDDDAWLRFRHQWRTDAPQIAISWTRMTGMTSEVLSSRFSTAAVRIPHWPELCGPVTGVVVLPNRLCWSGPADFDVTDLAERLTLYTLLMSCGQRADLAAYINGALLRHDWPNVKRLTTRDLTSVWEERLPQLTRT
jgi:hypothetical protein